MITLQLVCWTKTVAVPFRTPTLSIFDCTSSGDFVYSPFPLVRTSIRSWQMLIGLSTAENNIRQGSSRTQGTAVSGPSQYFTVWRFRSTSGGFPSKKTPGGSVIDRQSVRGPAGSGMVFADALKDTDSHLIFRGDGGLVILMRGDLEKRAV